MAHFLRQRRALGRSCRKLVFFLPLLLCAACISRPFIFKKNTDTRLPALAGGIVVTAKNENRTVHGYFVKHGPNLIVLFHGQASTMAREAIFGRVFASNGLSVLLVEYAGYGLAKKESPSESAIYDDSEVLVSHVQEAYSLPVARTVFWGRSLGSGVAAEMVLRKRGRAAILVTPYTSIAAVAENKSIPILPRLFVWDNFNTRSKASDIDAPVFLIGAGRDTLTPLKMTHDLAAKFPHAEEIILPNATHFNVHAHLSGAHWQQILRFAKN